MLRVTDQRYRRYSRLLANSAAKRSASLGVTFDDQVELPAVLAPAAEDKAPHFPRLIRFVDDACEQSQAQDGQQNFGQRNIPFDYAQGH